MIFITIFKIELKFHVTSGSALAPSVHTHTEIYHAGKMQSLLLWKWG